MRLVVATYGTEGDTRPLSALCHGLVEAGHEVRLLAAAGTLHSADALRVPATAFAGEIRAALSGGTTGLARLAKENTRAWTRQLLEAAEGCDAVLLSAVAAFVGFSVAEHLGIPAIGLGLIPITPSTAFASPFLPTGLVPQMLNRASHRLVNGLIWRSLRDATNRARAEILGLPPRRRVWDGHPMLYGISPALLPRPADWPDTAILCGQWIPPVPAWSPPETLGAFLAAGEKPLYVGFGSMAGLYKDSIFREVVAGIGGRRALFYPGWSGVDATALPGNFHVIGETPHDWLFPRTALVIHHGGSGTSHSAARAGVPSVVVPFAGDQPFWAAQLRQAGVAGAPVNGSRLTASALACAIALAETPEVRDRATALGAAMARENGVAQGVAALERLVKT